MPTSDGKPLAGEPGYVAPTEQPTGLLNTPATQPAVASTVTPAAYAVTPEQLTSSNVSKIISQDSPLLQQAQARAAQKANARGLLNSSMAVTAGESALYDAALPIASADAATQERAATNTVNAQNTANLTNAQINTSTSQFNAQAGNTAALTAAQIKSQAELQSVQSNTSLQLADKQAAVTKYVTENQAQLQTTLQNIQSNTSLSIADKQALTQTAISAADNATKLQMQQQQLAGDLQKISTDGNIRQGLAATEANYKMLMQTSAGAADLYKQTISNMASIMSDPNVADKSTAMNNMMTQLNDALGMIGDIVNMNLGTTLTFNYHN